MRRCRRQLGTLVRARMGNLSYVSTSSRLEVFRFPYIGAESPVLFLESYKQSLQPKINIEIDGSAAERQGKRLYIHSETDICELPFASTARVYAIWGYQLLITCSSWE